MIQRTRVRPLVLLLAASTAVLSHAPLAEQRPPTVTAIVGATVIDGNGGPPLADATVLVRGDRIAAVGPRTSITVPQDATAIDGAGAFVTPGFIDTNVHVSMYNGGETAVRYYPRRVEVTLEAAQLHLKYGVTTIRDSYGMLEPLLAVRDAVASGRDIGPRLLVAGNVVGWGGPFSISFSVQREIGLTLFQEQLNDAITQGVGEELIDMTPEELRAAINTYLDKGVDFIRTQLMLRHWFERHSRPTRATSAAQ